MSSIDELKELIDRLDPTERRAVTLFMQRENGNATQAQLLFSTLCSKDAPDAAALLPVLKISPTALANLRQSVYRTILKVLRNLQGTDTIDNELKEMQMNAQLLLHRRCYSQGMDELGKAANLARRFERRCTLLEILFLQCGITIERNAARMEEELSVLHAEIRTVLDDLNRESALKELREQSFLLLRTRFTARNDELREKMDGLFSSLPDPSVYRHSLGQAHHVSYALANRHLSFNEYEKAVAIYGQLIAQWEMQPDRIRKDSIIFLKLLFNHASAIFSAGDTKALPAAIEKLHAHECSSSEEEAEKFQNAYYLELLHLLNSDGFERLDPLVAGIEKGLVKYKTKINKGRELAFYHNIAMAYFLVHEWKKALAWIERIIAQEKSEHRQDLKHTARMLRLILWYELHKHELLEYELVNVERFLRKRKAWFAYESTVVKFFEKMLVTDTDEQHSLIENFQKKLTEAVDGKTSAALPGSSELSYWAKSKLTGKNMRTLLKEER